MKCATSRKINLHWRGQGKEKKYDFIFNFLNIVIMKAKKNNNADISKVSKKELIQRAKKFSKRFCVSNGKNFKLKDYDPSDDGNLGQEDKPLAKQALQLGVQALAAMQDVLYAQDRWSILLIFQAMDAAGKDGAIKHVMSGVNPQGCQVSSFKAPSAEDLTMIIYGVV
jgi:polyphosphate kinase 2 (PPK2 family)